MSEVAFPSSEVAVVDETNYRVSENALANSIKNLQAGRTDIWSTIRGNDFDVKLDTVEALDSAKPIAENLGKPLDIVNIIVQPIEMADQESGELRPVPRIVFITRNDGAYWAISDVLFRELETKYALFGDPNDWPEGKFISKIEREGQGTRKYFVWRIERVKAAK